MLKSHFSNVNISNTDEYRDRLRYMKHALKSLGESKNVESIDDIIQGVLSETT